jgi:hypothetical protein
MLAWCVIDFVLVNILVSWLVTLFGDEWPLTSTDWRNSRTVNACSILYEFISFINFEIWNDLLNSRPNKVLKTWLFQWFVSYFYYLFIQPSVLITSSCMQWSSARQQDFLLSSTGLYTIMLPPLPFYLCNLVKLGSAPPETFLLLCREWTEWYHSYM